METKLKKISKKFSEIKANDDNFSIGGGLADGAFASRRHEDAKYDEGKLTEGKATQLFMKATGEPLEKVKEVINYAVPNMEWHHAGKLPKSYGGGMKKSYFLNSSEIVEIAEKWFELVKKIEIRNSDQKIAEEIKKEKEGKKLSFLNENAVKKIRVKNPGKFFYEIDKEMNGKYGWFSSYGKSYNMTEYVTGWEFESEEKYNEFLSIK